MLSFILLKHLYATFLLHGELVHSIKIQYKETSRRGEVAPQDGPGLCHTLCLPVDLPLRLWVFFQLAPLS